MANNIFQNPPLNCLQVSSWKKHNPESGVSFIPGPECRPWNFGSHKFPCFIFSNTQFHGKPFITPWSIQGHCSETMAKHIDLAQSCLWLGWRVFTWIQWRGLCFLGSLDVIGFPSYWNGWGLGVPLWKRKPPGDSTQIFLVSMDVCRPKLWKALSHPKNQA